MYQNDRNVRFVLFTTQQSILNTKTINKQEK